MFAVILKSLIIGAIAGFAIAAGAARCSMHLKYRQWAHSVHWVR